MFATKQKLGDDLRDTAERVHLQRQKPRGDYDEHKQSDATERGIAAFCAFKEAFADAMRNHLELAANQGETADMLLLQKSGDALLLTKMDATVLASDSNPITCVDLMYLFEHKSILAAFQNEFEIYFALRLDPMMFAVVPCNANNMQRRLNLRISWKSNK